MPGLDLKWNTYYAPQRIPQAHSVRVTRRNDNGIVSRLDIIELEVTIHVDSGLFDHESNCPMRQDGDFCLAHHYRTVWKK